MEVFWDEDGKVMGIPGDICVGSGRQGKDLALITDPTPVPRQQPRQSWAGWIFFFHLLS